MKNHIVFNLFSSSIFRSIDRVGELLQEENEYEVDYDYLRLKTILISSFPIIVRMHCVGTVMEKLEIKIKFNRK